MKSRTSEKPTTKSTTSAKSAKKPVKKSVRAAAKKTVSKKAATKTATKREPPTKAVAKRLPIESAGVETAPPPPQPEPVAPPATPPQASDQAPDQVLNRKRRLPQRHLFLSSETLPDQMGAHVPAGKCGSVTIVLGVQIVKTCCLQALSVSRVRRVAFTGVKSAIVCRCVVAQSVPPSPRPRLLDKWQGTMGSCWMN